MAEPGGEGSLQLGEQAAQQAAEPTTRLTAPEQATVGLAAEQTTPGEATAGVVVHEPPPEPPLTEPQPDSVAPEKSQQSRFNLQEALKTEFGLTDEQVELLEKEGFNEESLSDPKRITALITRLREIATPEQEKKIKQFEDDLTQAQSPEGQQQSREQLKQRINAKRKEIAENPSLSQKEKTTAIAQLDEMERLLDQQEQQQEGQSEQLTPEKLQKQQEQQKQQVKNKAKEYLQYAGFGLLALFIIFMLQGAKGQGGQ